MVIISFLIIQTLVFVSSYLGNRN